MNAVYREDGRRLCRQSHWQTGRVRMRLCRLYTGRLGGICIRIITGRLDSLEGCPCRLYTARVHRQVGD
jgi:hypothetical protein